MAKKKAKRAAKKPAAKKKAKRTYKKRATGGEPIPEKPLNLPEAIEIPERPEVPGNRMVRVVLGKGQSPEVHVHEHLKFLESIGKPGTGRSEKGKVSRVAKPRKVSKSTAETTAGVPIAEKRKTENPAFQTAHDRTEAEK